MKNPCFLGGALAALGLVLASTVTADIIEVIETGRGADLAAVIEASFDEDVLTYSDRPAHEHNGVAFNSSTGLLSTTGDEIIPLPEYLVGHNYVRFANDARDQAGYSAIVKTDAPSIFYVLIDNRINGQTRALKANTTDPVLGGSLQWVIDGGWERVNTGLSPNGEGDYTGVDETGLTEGTVGPGVGINNFMAVYRFPTAATQVTVSNYQITGTNMIAVVAAPAPPQTEPIVSFTGLPLAIAPGQSADLSWLIDPAATAAAIDNGVGSILPLSDSLGAGTVTVSPLADTTYTLTATAGGVTRTASVTVVVTPLASFTISRSHVESGAPVTLAWRVRPGATVTLEGQGVPASPVTTLEGTGSAVVTPSQSGSYTITAEAGGQTATATVGVAILPPGRSFALIDLGWTNSRQEPGVATGRDIGMGTADTNLTDLPEMEILSDTGAAFFLSMDALDAFDSPIGGLDWRDRGNGPTDPLCRLVEDFVKNNAGLIRVVLRDLPAGTYNVASYHLDPANSQCAEIAIRVTDARGVDQDTGVTADASYEGHPANTGAPTVAGLTTGLAAAKAAHFQVVSNGTDDVIIWFDGTQAGVDIEVPLGGLHLTLPPPRPEDDTFLLVDVGTTNGLPEPGAAGNAVLGVAAADTNGTNLEPVSLTTRTGQTVTFALDNLDPDGFPIGGLDWRLRGLSVDIPLCQLGSDLVKNNLGLIHATLGGLPAGDYEATAYLFDSNFSQCEAIQIMATDAKGERRDTGVTGDASYPGGDAAAPTPAGINTGIVAQKGARFSISANGTDDVHLWFNGQSAGDLEVPFAGLRLRRAAAPVATIAVTRITRTVSTSTAAVAIEFQSTPGSTYRVLAGSSLTSLNEVLAASLPASAGATTTFTESAIPLATTQRFYRIVKN